ncbi:hypothetical protein BU23DRAFT_575596 [Bimuria novae-zelandiae CBS 107.79]|uniref:Uncharacterized protein n=1 Tax=Bimuria novae-zelandiae CBS 107.79 TaxID=1447943 RepID=A0A6A5UJP1_9PLEO|nr:hypothetical protein BU23DRAFT_575596 [Bimuria novae-zelandiae CBS 107.79]
MSPTLLVLFLVCFSIGFLLSLWLVFEHVKPTKSNNTNWTPEPFSLDRGLAILSYLCQACLFTAGLVVAGMQLRNNDRVTWLDFVTFCIIQVLTLTMFVRVSASLLLRQWIIWLSYGAATLSIVAGLVFYKR